LKLHIVFLAAWYPDLHDPMFGLFVHKHAVLMSKDYTISVLHVSYYNNEPNGLYVGQMDGVQVFRLNIKTKFRPLRWLYFIVASQKAYRHIIKRNEKPIINHVHVLTRMGVLALWFKFRYGIPFVVTEHWSRYFSAPGTYRNVFRKYFTRKVCRKAAALSAVSNSLKNAMLNHNIGVNKKWLIINNAVNENVFNLDDNRLNDSVISFINVSCFEDRSKNLSGLVECVRRLVDDGLNIKCILVGTGQDYERIALLVKEKNLENNIVFTGQLTEQQVAEYMNRSHFYVQSSNYENVPVVISEALMCGLPVVATNVGGVAEMIDESNGYLVNGGQLNELVSAIRLMTENYSEFDRKKINNSAMQKYSNMAVRQQIMQLYSIIDE